MLNMKQIAIKIIKNNDKFHLINVEYRYVAISVCIISKQVIKQPQMRKYAENINKNIFNTHRPRSSRLSSIDDGPLSSFPVPKVSFNPGLPGWMSVTKHIPSIALIIDVIKKYIRVLTAILPFNRAFKLALPAIKLDIINGRIRSFNIRINSSPGYEMSKIAFCDKLT